MNELLVAYLESIGYRHNPDPYKHSLYHPTPRTFWQGNPGYTIVIFDDGTQGDFGPKGVRTHPVNDLEGPTIKHFRD